MFDKVHGKRYSGTFTCCTATTMAVTSIKQKFYVKFRAFVLLEQFQDVLTMLVYKNVQCPHYLTLPSGYWMSLPSGEPGKWCEVFT